MGDRGGRTRFRADSLRGRLLSRRADARPRRAAACRSARQHDPHAALGGLRPAAVHRPGGRAGAAVTRRHAGVRAADGTEPMSWRTVVGDILLIGGGALEVIAVLGLCVMRDVYDRLHYAGLASVGALLIAAAIVVRESFS